MNYTSIAPNFMAATQKTGFQITQLSKAMRLSICESPSMTENKESGFEQNGRFLLLSPELSTERVGKNAEYLVSFLEGA